MKEKIHPKYGKATVECSCGNKFETGSTISKIHVEICSACHPFFTGKKKLVDEAGRVERFAKMLKKTEEMKKDQKGKAKKKKVIAKVKKTAGKKKAINKQKSKTRVKK